MGFFKLLMNKLRLTVPIMQVSFTSTTMYYVVLEKKRKKSW